MDADLSLLCLVDREPFSGAGKPCGWDRQTDNLGCPIVENSRGAGS